MTRNRKGRAGCNQATLKTSKRTKNFNGLRARIKAVMVTMSLWRLSPISLANWIVHLGGQRDV